MPSVEGKGFFEEFFRGITEGYVTLTYIEKKYISSEWFDLTDCDVFSCMWEKVQQHKDSVNVYFSTSPARSIPDGHEKHRINAKIISCIPAFFLDVDTKEDPLKKNKDVPESIDAAIGALSALEYPPSMAVISGHGVHAYWLFKTPLIVQNEIECDAANRRMRCCMVGVAEALGFTDLDVGASELTRVLRVPSTKNHKHEQVQPVRLLDEGPWTRYDVEELETTYSKSQEANPLHFSHAVLWDNNSADLRTDDECIAEIMRMPSASRVFSGDLSLHHNNANAADMALNVASARVTGQNPAQMNRVFEKSGLMREKWTKKHYANGDTYGQRTIKNAILRVQACGFRKVRQFPETNALSQAIPRDSDIQYNGDAVMHIDSITVIIHLYRDLLRKINRKSMTLTVMRLMDAVMMQHTEQLLPSATVSLLFQDYAKLCAVTDIQFVREQMYADVMFLLGTTIICPEHSWYKMKKGPMVEMQLFSKIDHLRGGYEFTFGDEFYKLICAHEKYFMYCPSELWRINTNKNPYSYSLLRKITLHKRINLLGERAMYADTISVSALLNAIPLFPTYKSVRESGRKSLSRI